MAGSGPGGSGQIPSNDRIFPSKAQNVSALWIERRYPILPPTFINLSDLDVPPTDRRISGLSALSVRPIVLHTQDKYGIRRPLHAAAHRSSVVRPQITRSKPRAITSSTCAYLGQYTHITLTWMIKQRADAKRREINRECGAAEPLASPHLRKKWKIIVDPIKTRGNLRPARRLERAIEPEEKETGARAACLSAKPESTLSL